MAHFSKIRLNGFKSFADPAELVINKGLTGIIGPNGCGKSNLVEALRWVMGESSAKKMRGDGMEDVIFSGTDKRARRMSSEVSMVLANPDHTLPPPYTQEDELDITRQIERDKGSTYKINGKTVRARDVQMLFADLISGAHSPALVSQGKVTEMINAKPSERRTILEDSAGIAGLYARRHEAELRLRAADQNLLRLDDLLDSMNGRLSGLKRQARQAIKYRELQAQIRQHEIILAALAWHDIKHKTKQSQTRFNEMEDQMRNHMQHVSAFTAEQASAVENLQELKEKSTASAAALQAQRIELARSEQQLESLKREHESKNQSLLQARQDFVDLEQLNTEQIETLQKLDAEFESLKTVGQDDSHVEQELAQKRDKAQQDLSDHEERFRELRAQERTHTENLSRLKTLQQTVEDNISNLQARIHQYENELKAFDTIDSHALEKLDCERNNLRGEITKAKEALNKTLDLEEKQDKTRQSLEDKALQAKQKFMAVESEIAALYSLLAQDDNDEQFTPIHKNLKIKSGYELAVSRALGEGLNATTDAQSPNYWQNIDTNIQSNWPQNTNLTVMADILDAPKALSLALSFIAITDDAQLFETVTLSAGQIIVSKNGALRRWDGYRLTSEAHDARAEQLRCRTRLESLEKNLATLAKHSDKAQKDYTAAKEKLDTTRAAITLQKQNLQTQENAFTKTDEQYRRDFETQNADLSKKQNFEGLIRASHEDLKKAEADKKNYADEIAVIEKENEAAHQNIFAQMVTCEEALETARNTYFETQRAYDNYIQEHSRNKARIQALSDERIMLQNRMAKNVERLESMKARISDLETSLHDQQSTKADESPLNALLDNIAILETKAQADKNALNTCENALHETERALKESEHALSNLREERAEVKTLLGTQKEQLLAAQNDIETRFETSPDTLLKNIDTNIHAGHARQILEKLTRDRDAIGPVNLVAEDEASALQKEVDDMTHERADLTAAIDTLRKGINKLNREARERLVKAFEDVNRHFETLFTRLFGGGKAYLELIESDDPLESGLEIFAQPPGKSLQTLSLLSGGEQTLASIALIFAMFLTNPGPVCVLDEIDAPLDDANVDRVCTLLEDMVKQGTTRFLVITHHRMTMARMDRLYGVTMGERGVSQLVSVDMNDALQEDFLEDSAA